MIEITQSQKDSAYQVGRLSILATAYGRKFSSLEAGKCGEMFPTFDQWYESLNDALKDKVDAWLQEEHKHHYPP